MMMLYWLQQTGNKPITLMGGGTTMVGDPSGKDESRPLRTVEEIEANKASIRTVFAKVLRFGAGSTDAIMVDNAEWLLKLGYIEMLRDVGRHFSVNRMLTMDSVRLRLEREQEMSFIEFNYMVCQSYDFVELARRHGCNLQMGGSDQWGNIVNGVDLGRRMGTHQLYALTTPLLTTASGAKMGKTAQGAVWLNADQFSPYDFWQYWRNTEDADVVPFLKLFTALPMAEIARLEALGGSEINEAKKVLATEATTLLHGRAAADEAAETARKTFEEGALAETPADGRDRARFARSRHGLLSLFVTCRAWPLPTARRGAMSRAARCASTTSRSRTNAASSACPMSAAEGVDQAVARPEEARARQACLARRVASTRLTWLAMIDGEQRHYLNSKIDRKMPGAITDSGLICSVG